jgi:hypothetical protein
MSMSQGYGKKETSNKFLDLPELEPTGDEAADQTHICHPDLGIKDPGYEIGELIRLGTFTGPVVEKEGKRTYTMYWRLLCINCFKEFKQASSVFEIEDLSYGERE